MVLSGNRWRLVQRVIRKIVTAINKAEPGSYAVIGEARHRGSGGSMKTGRRLKDSAVQTMTLQQARKWARSEAGEKDMGTRGGCGGDAGRHERYPGGSGSRWMAAKSTLSAGDPIGDGMNAENEGTPLTKPTSRCCCTKLCGGRPEHRRNPTLLRGGANRSAMSSRAVSH